MYNSLKHFGIIHYLYLEIAYKLLFFTWFDKEFILWIITKKTLTFTFWDKKGVLLLD